MKTKKLSINNLVFILLTFTSFSSIAETTRWLTRNMPHYYEFNSTENPNRYGWCGHTVLKAAGQYVSGITKTLPQIHTTFYNNSTGYKANTYCGASGYNWCASLQDLLWAARLSQNGGYGRSGISSAITQYSTQSGFFDIVKNAINSNKPVIVPSNWKYTNVGHFWIIVGYTDWGTGRSALYLRDVAIASPNQANADWAVYVDDFYKATPARQMLIMQ